MLPVFAWLLDHAPDFLVLLLLSLFGYIAWRVQGQADATWAHIDATLDRIAEHTERQTELQEKAFAPAVPLATQQAVATFLGARRQFQPAERRAALLASIDGPVLMRVTLSNTPADHIQSIVETCAAAGEECFRILLKNAIFALNGSQDGTRFKALCKAHGFDLDAGPH